MEKKNHQQTKKRGGWKLSEDTKRRIGNAVRGRKLSEETKAKIKAKWTLERRARHSKEHSGINNAFFGKTWSKEHRVKIMTTWTPARKEKARLAKLGTKLPPGKGNRVGHRPINTPHPKCIIENCQTLVRLDNKLGTCRMHRPLSLRWKAQQKNYRDLNRDKIRRLTTEYAKKHREEKRLYDAKRVPLLRDKRRPYYANYVREKRRTDPLYKLRYILRHRIWSALNTKYTKNKKTIELLGATVPFVKQYLEAQFLEGMDWSNHGQWHIDHKIPLFSAHSQEEIENLCHYTNLQPLWAKENLSKGKKLPYSQPSLKGV